MHGGSLTPYWQDDESTDWEAHSTATAEDTELRWSDPDTRPNSKWLRFGLLMRTDDQGQTPILRAHSVKFHSMTGDRWRWNLLVPVSNSQEQLDGSLNAYTVAQRKAHIESLIQRVPPVLYQDIDGTQYEVKVVSASRAIMEAEYYGAELAAQYVYSLVLEQVTNASYS